MPGPDGKAIMHAELQIGNSIVFLADEFPDMGCRAPQTLGGTTGTLHIYVRDVDRAFQRAVAAGAEVRMPADRHVLGRPLRQGRRPVRPRVGARDPQGEPLGARDRAAGRRRSSRRWGADRERCRRRPEPRLLAWSPRRPSRRCRSRPSRWAASPCSTGGASRSAASTSRSPASSARPCPSPRARRRSSGRIARPHRSRRPSGTAPPPTRSTTTTPCSRCRATSRRRSCRDSSRSRRRAGASGRDVLTAFVLGVEVMCRVSRALAPGHYRAGWHATATLGPARRRGRVRPAAGPRRARGSTGRSGWRRHSSAGSTSRSARWGSRSRSAARRPTGSWPRCWPRAA